MAGQAIPSYAPMQSAAHFQKLECFCFKQQTLEAVKRGSFRLSSSSIRRCRRM